MKSVVSLLAAGFISVASSALSQSGDTLFVTHNSYGAPGIIEMPVAKIFPDARLSFGLSHFTAENRNLINFQFHPRVNLGFRYSRLRDFGGGTDLYDRSFSIQLLLKKESEFAPALALGVNDALGTGITASEYLVATKSLFDSLSLSAGIGFGRISGRSNFKNPLGVLDDKFNRRPQRDYSLEDDQGGTVQFGQLFRGDGAFFGGIEWRPRPDLVLMAEYSPDVYPRTEGKVFNQKTPYNFGLKYVGKQNYELSAYYLYGSEIGVMATTYLNPKEPTFGPGLDPAPPAVAPAEALSAQALGWSSPRDVSSGTSALQAALEQQNLSLKRFNISQDTAYVEVVRSGYSRPAQVIGRTARVMTRTLPPEIKRFSITPVSSGVKGAEVVMMREMLEANENHFDGSWQSYLAADFQEPDLNTQAPVLPSSLDRELSVTPYIKSSYFDPDDPYRGDVGVQVRGTYEFFEGSYVQGIMRQRVAGTLSESTRESDSVLPRVRSEMNRYDKNGDLLLTELTYNHRYQAAPSVFTRATIGYLEPAFAGISTEVLWKPYDKRYGVGLEMNYVKQRDFDQHFGLRDYDVASGHVSLYYELGSGYHAQVDVGRYLAGDKGGTLSLAREFENGWRIGAFATLTDVSFEDFGEGSFDKGFQVTIPTNLVSGEPTSNRYSTTLRPIMRDGGARVNVSGRLYDAVRELQKPELADSWGRFWK
ncbi:YjbH domain-containing protein [Donghicola eburneus]|uniref:YjbH domain-containing protein n=1 Tax=Donghicola eburneus TaxID=393278 RepID=UPI0008E7DF78|nr:YjbH domain-containing protein [Donghicola eburneus]SFQ78672.1 Exopolysaccharide biosynthesis protein YbjH [Donghicola eburneus]